MSNQPSDNHENKPNNQPDNIEQNQQSNTPPPEKKRKKKNYDFNPDPEKMKETEARFDREYEHESEIMKAHDKVSHLIEKGLRNRYPYSRIAIELHLLGLDTDSNKVRRYAKKKYPGEYDNRKFKKTTKSKLLKKQEPPEEQVPRNVGDIQ